MTNPQPTSFEMLASPAVVRVPVSARPESSASARPIGTRVRAGERLTTSAHQLDAWPLAPLAGDIVGVGDVALTSGVVVPAIELRPDGSADVADFPPPPLDTDRAGWLDRLRELGLQVDRRTSPNLLMQLAESLQRPIDTVVCSALDGDPNLPIGSAMASSETENLIAGVRTIARIAASGRSLIVMQQRLLPQVALAVKKSREARAVEIVNDYPQADPTILLATLLRRKLRPGRLPTEQGVVLLDAVAAVMVGRIARQSRPMLATPIALFDHARNATHLQTVPIGTSLSHLLQMRQIAAGGFHFRGGDVLRDQRIGRETVLGTGEVALHASPATRDVNPDPCIRCGWCVESCPSRIHPAGLLDAAQRRDREQAQYYGLHACVECGLCDYVCPSRLPILAGIRSMRKGI